MTSFEIFNAAVKIIFVCFLTLSVPVNSYSQEIAPKTNKVAMPDDKYLPLFKDVAAKYNIPFNLLLSLSKQESNFNPWAVNIAGKSYFPKSKKAAVALVTANRDKGYDVGLMQINKWWIEKRLKLKLEDVLEPEINVHLAGWMLNELFHTYGNKWEVIGAYHTPPQKNHDRALSYAKTVGKKFEGYANHLKDASAGELRQGPKPLKPEPAETEQKKTDASGALTERDSGGNHISPPQKANAVGLSVQRTDGINYALQRPLLPESAQISGFR